MHSRPHPRDLEFPLKTRFAVAVVAVVVAVALVPPAEAKTFTVDSTLDTIDADQGNGVCADAGGNCTFRAAILEANAYDAETPHVIAFAVKSLLPLSELPQIIRQGTTVDGWTHPDWVSGGPPVVVLSGESAGNSPGLRLGGSNLTVRGLVIHSYQRTGIIIEGGTTGATIHGCYIGTNGVTDLGNSGYGIFAEATSGNTIGGSGPDEGNVISGNVLGGVVIDGFGSSATNNVIKGNLIGVNAAGTSAMPNDAAGVVLSYANSNTIGGADPGDRNVISGNGSEGITVVSGSTGNIIYGNFIGTDITGSAAIPNALGVHLLQGAVATRIGGADAGEGNVISGNTADGIFVAGGSTATMVQGNLVGVDALATGALGNGSHGIHVSAAPDNYIGGSTPGSANTIAHNVGAGIAIEGQPPDCIVKAILGNSIHDNGGLGIDLGIDGVTVNDVGDGDTGPNNLQNFPTLASATSGGGNTIVEGSLNSTPSTDDYLIQFFASPTCDPSGYGEGYVFLGDTTVSTDSSGNADFVATLDPTVAPGMAITATTTDASGNTSEFSACVAVAAQFVEPVPAISLGGLMALAVFLALAGGILLRVRGS